MTEITDAVMMEELKKLRPYSVLILKVGPNRDRADVQQVVWQHARRNMELRAAGKLAVVCPINDGSDVCGVGVFDAPVEDVKTIMDSDPGVQAGVFVYEVHASRSFPGDRLPG